MQLGKEAAQDLLDAHAAVEGGSCGCSVCVDAAGLRFNLVLGESAVSSPLPRRRAPAALVEELDRAARGPALDPDGTPVPNSPEENRLLRLLGWLVDATPAVRQRTVPVKVAPARATSARTWRALPTTSRTCRACWAAVWWGWSPRRSCWPGWRVRRRATRRRQKRPPSTCPPRRPSWGSSGRHGEIIGRPSSGAGQRRARPPVGKPTGGFSLRWPDATLPRRHDDATVPLGPAA